MTSHPFPSCLWRYHSKTARFSAGVAGPGPKASHSVPSLSYIHGHISPSLPQFTADATQVCGYAQNDPESHFQALSIGRSFSQAQDCCDC